MALARPLPPLWQSLLPAVTGPVRPIADIPLLQRLALPFGIRLGAAAIPSLSIPSIPSLQDIWNGILNAVPKKKTSYSKKRSRLLAGKGLKDITSLNRCSSCGRVKRLHLLCPYCVDAIKTHIFGQINWAIRRPTTKQAKQLARDRRFQTWRDRTSAPDPRKEKEDQILKHTGWKK